MNLVPQQPVYVPLRNPPANLGSFPTRSDMTMFMMAMNWSPIGANPLLLFLSGVNVLRLLDEVNSGSKALLIIIYNACPCVGCVWVMGSSSHHWHASQSS